MESKKTRFRAVSEQIEVKEKVAKAKNQAKAFQSPPPAVTLLVTLLCMVVFTPLFKWDQG